MKKNWLERTELLIKETNLEKLKNANVLVIGLGGVGSFAAEFLARAGVGKMTIVDGDVVDITNINRQLPALHSTIGKLKAEIVGERLLDINPELQLIKINEFLNPENMEDILDSQKFDYVLDCIDSVTPKITLIKSARRKKIKIVSCMGAGGKIDPAKVMVRDLSKTHNCYLAKQVRKRLKKEKSAMADTVDSQNYYKGFAPCLCDNFPSSGRSPCSPVSAWPASSLCSSACRCTAWTTAQTWSRPAACKC